MSQALPHDETDDFAAALPLSTPANHAPVVEGLLGEAIELVDQAQPLPLWNGCGSKAKRFSPSPGAAPSAWSNAPRS